MKSTAKRYALIAFLTVVFIIDDVLIYLLLKDAFDWQVDPLLFASGGIAVAALNLAGAVVAYRTMRRKPTTGRRGMIGKQGVVISSSGDGDLQVRVQGELWQARINSRVRVGDKIKVERVEGLCLVVSKKEDSRSND